MELPIFEHNSASYVIEKTSTEKVAFLCHVPLG
jgi:hypothetical protein